MKIEEKIFIQAMDKAIEMLCKKQGLERSEFGRSQLEATKDTPKSFFFSF